VLGIDDNLPEATQEAFRATGTAHLTAISGVNIAIVISLVFGLFRKLAGRIGGLVLSTVAIIAFTLLVGAPASAVRAALMGGLGLAGEQIGRRRAGIHSLCLTAAVMTAFNPAILWDAGFQLSFSATLGILWLNEPLQKGFTKLLESALPGETARKIARPLGDYLIVTLAAQIATLPILAITFGQLSLSAPFVNPLILPAQPAIMALGGLALAGGWLSPFVGQVFAWLAWPLLAYTLKIVEAIGEFTGLVVYVRAGWGFAAAYYALLAFFFAIYPRLGNWKPRIRPVAILLILGLFATVLWRLVVDRPDQKLTITLIPNPGGPAVLIRLPEGNFILVNGGRSGRELAAALETWLPPTQRQLAGIFLNTADNSFLSGLPDVVGRWQPGLIYWPDEVAASNSGKEITNLLGMGGETLETGMIFDLGSGVTLSIPATSQSEAALRLTYGNFDALLSGGIGISDFQKKPDGLDYILLTPANLERIQPDGVRPLGSGTEIEENQSDPTLDAQGAPWLVLAQQSWIQLVTDGEKIWITQQP
jgi:competence protein ComEC